MLLKVNKKIGHQNVSFTPAFYKRAYTNYLNGEYRDLLALIERAETDSFISGCLMARHTGYKREFSVNPFSESAKDVEIAEFIENVFENLYMREFFEDMIDARFKIFTIIALEWDVVNGKQVPVAAQKFEQKYFRRDPEDGILKVDFGKILKPIEPDAAFVIDNKKRPIMLKVLKDYIRKEFGEENWSSFLEVFGEAFIIGKYPAGASPTQRTEVETGINTIAGSTRGVVPEGTEIQIVESKRDTGDHKNFVQDCKEGISIALLGHKDAAGSDKQMQIGDNESGIKVKKEIAVDDMVWLEEKIKPFIRMIINRNFNTTNYPYLTFDKSDTVDQGTKLEALRIGLESGAEVDPDFLSQYGIPVINKDVPLKKQSIFNELNQG